jgi:hypothetical protein
MAAPTNRSPVTDRSRNRQTRGKGGPPPDRHGRPQRRKPWTPEAGTLPRWISEELARVTPRPKLAEAQGRLLAAAQAFAAGRHGKAFREAEIAKELSPRDATVREVLGLAAYRMQRWEIALRELRTFRRLTGDTVHLPVEMDVLRALDRPDDVASAWATMRRIGGDRSTIDEARVVYGSFLLDRGDARAAWEVAGPKRLADSPRESEVRVWYVGARAAARLGDAATARQIFEAIQQTDPAMPGLDELDRLIDQAASE